MTKFMIGLLLLCLLAILSENGLTADIRRAPPRPDISVSGASKNVACSENEDEGFISEIPLRAQETGSWCWAASQQMLMWHHGAAKFREQCSIVNTVLKRNRRIDPSENCCDESRKNDPICVQTAWPNFPLYSFDVTQVDVTNVNDPLGSSIQDGWSAIKTQICNRLPFLITLERPTNAHQYIVNGYKVTRAGIRTVDLIDPSGEGYYDEEGFELPDFKIRTYDEYRFDVDGKAVHSRDFINILPR